MLNACRHRSDRHGIQACLYGSFAKCSTPAGIGAIVTPLRCDIRLSGAVLNACRHRSDRHLTLVDNLPRIF